MLRRWLLADLPLTAFLNEAVVPYESDEVTRLIFDTHDAAAFAPVASLTVGGLRDWLLSYDATGESLAALAPGLTPEMAAAVSKLMRVQDLGRGCPEDSGGYALPDHGGAGRAALHPAAAEPSYGRSDWYCGGNY